jgi:DME family drug/metabolite transporter
MPWSEARGPLLVALASLLWATDALFRVPILQTVEPVWIVTLEHVLAVLLLLPWMILRGELTRVRLSLRQWAAFILIGGGASAVATVLFTAAFRYTNPSVIILLQKLQPVLVVLLAIIFLRERPQKGFFLWASLALFAAIGLSSPDLGTGALREGVALRSTGVVYALTAAGIWALSTIVGKRLLSKLSFEATTFWRFTIGLATLLLLVLATRSPFPVAALQEPETWKALLYIALLPGLSAMLAYYAGLKRTPASVTTLVELLFPISAVLLNALFLGVKLDLNQLAAGALLLFSVTRISLSRKN